MASSKILHRCNPFIRQLKFQQDRETLDVNGKVIALEMHHEFPLHLATKYPKAIRYWTLTSSN